MDIIMLTGVSGLILILFAFSANEFGMIARKSYLYNVLNLLGALFLGYYAFDMRNPVFVFLEIVWGAISLYFIFKLWYFRKNPAS